MSVTIELPPETEAQLQEVAARQGQDPATFVRAAVEEKLRSLRNAPTTGNGGADTGMSENGATAKDTGRLSMQEFDASLEELAAIGDDIPPSDERITYSRADIYFDHD